MIVTKQIFSRTRGMDDEDYAYLNYDKATQKFTITKTSSYKKSGSLKWKSEETHYELDNYLIEFPEHKAKVLELKSAILADEESI